MEAGRDAAAPAHRRSREQPLHHRRARAALPEGTHAAASRSPALTRLQALLRVSPNLTLARIRHRLRVDIGVAVAETTLQRSMRTLLNYSRKKLVRMSLRKMLPANAARYQFWVNQLQPEEAGRDLVVRGLS